MWKSGRYSKLTLYCEPFFYEGDSAQIEIAFEEDKKLLCAFMQMNFVMTVYFMWGGNGLLNIGLLIDCFALTQSAMN